MHSLQASFNYAFYRIIVLDVLLSSLPLYTRIYVQSVIIELVIFTTLCLLVLLVY